MKAEMDGPVRDALRRDRTIDITTTGRHTGQRRRIEIWFHNLDDRIYLTGRPGIRSWYANLLANASFTFHLKESIQRDLPAMAIPIVDEEQRRTVLEEITRRLGVSRALEDWVAASPLVEVRL
jgi:hypothetical protein